MELEKVTELVANAYAELEAAADGAEVEYVAVVLSTGELMAVTGGPDLLDVGTLCYAAYEDIEAKANQAMEMLDSTPPEVIH